MTPYFEVLPEGDAGLSVLGSALLVGFGVFINLFFCSLDKRSTDITRNNGIEQGGRAEQCPMWGVLPGPSPSLTLSSIYDGLGVTVTCIIT